MDAFPILEPQKLTDASIHGEFCSHVNRLIIFLPDDCPKASNVTLSFLSSVADGKLVSHLIKGVIIGKLGDKLFIDARKFELLRSLLVHKYPDQCARLLYKGLQGINLSDWPEIYREEQRKHDQAAYSRQFLVTHKQIFCGFERECDTGFRSRKGGLFGDAWLQQQQQKKMSRKIRLTDAPISLKVGGQGGEIGECDTGFRPRKGGLFGDAWLQQQQQQKKKKKKMSRKIRLTDATIFLKVGGQGGDIGTLKVCANEFVYVTTGIPVHFKFDNVVTCFFRLGDERMPPLLHFHLHDYIGVGTEKVKDIQFHLVGHERSDRDSSAIKQETKRIRVEGRNIDLKTFVAEVRGRRNSVLKPPCLFEEIVKEYEFDGVFPSETSAYFALTVFSLVVFQETHFIVVPLRDIDIVHLALLRPGKIDMTIILQDFKVESLVEISSIPLESLSSIKHCLNRGHVKYYVNAEKQDWNSIVEEIADFPAEFMEKGGWGYYKLEDSHTLAYYNEVSAA